MTFWSNEAINAPSMKRNFKVSTNDPTGGVWWWAVTATKPSFEVSVNEYQIVNQKHKYPGVLSWNDVTVTIYDVGEKVKQLYEQLGKNGYVNPDKYNKNDGIVKAWAGDPTAADFIIEQYGANLQTPIEQWTLKNCFVKSINFGDLDYASDEFVSIELTLSYDYAELDGATQTPTAKGFPASDGISLTPAGGGGTTNSKPTSAPKPTDKKPGDQKSSPTDDKKSTEVKTEEKQEAPKIG